MTGTAPVNLIHTFATGICSGACLGSLVVGLCMLQATTSRVVMELHQKKQVVALVASCYSISYFVLLAERLLA